MSYFLNGITQHYADFGGRASRREFWMFTLFAFLGAVAAMLLDDVLDPTAQSRGGGWIYFLYALALFLPGLAIGVRRLHDVGKSGWFCFIVLIPLAGVIWFLILMCRVGQPTNNECGKSPMTAPPSSTREPEPSAVRLPEPEIHDERPLTRACPECGETILPVARKCKHCHSALTPELEKALIVKGTITEPPTPIQSIQTALIGTVILASLFVVALGFALPAISSWQNERDHRAMGLPGNLQESSEGEWSGMTLLGRLDKQLLVSSCQRKGTIITCLAQHIGQSTETLEGFRFTASASKLDGVTLVKVAGAFVSVPDIGYGQKAELKVHVPAETYVVYLSYQ